jgi:hypothetical protein
MRPTVDWRIIRATFKVPPRSRAKKVYDFSGQVIVIVKKGVGYARSDGISALQQLKTAPGICRMTIID